jgi:hypothetical protein
MTRDEARAHAAQLNAEHPDRRHFRWIAHEATDGWDIARLTLPNDPSGQPPIASVEARPRPPQPGDPRPVAHRNIGGPYGL